MMRLPWCGKVRNLNVLDSSPGPCIPICRAALVITAPDGKPLTFAGLWEKWKDGLLSATILTTDAGDSTRELHGRMPLMLDQAGIENWLGGGRLSFPSR